MGSKIKIWRMLQWNSCRQKPDVLSNTQVLRKLVKADSVCIFFWLCFWFFLLQNITMYTALAWFSFSLFYILLFSVHIVDVNAAKSGSVLDNLRVNIYVYAYIHMFQVQVVIWETLCACYFRSTSLSLTRFLFSTKALRFKRWKLGSPMTCALIVSSLRLSAFFIYDKRAWRRSVTQLTVVHFWNE